MTMEKKKKTQPERNRYLCFVLPRNVTPVLDSDTLRYLCFVYKMSDISIWPIDRTLSGATPPGQSWLGSDGNEGVLCIPQSSSITGASDCLVSSSGHSSGESYPSAEMQSVYSAAPAEWASHFRRWTLWTKFKFWTKLFEFHFMLKLFGKAWIHLFSPS